jgi:hypothetical protein
MLTLTFESVSGDGRFNERAPYFRIKNDTLRAGPDDHEIAVFRDGAWHAGGRPWGRVAVAGPVEVHFQNHGRRCSHLRDAIVPLGVIGGSIRYGAQFERVRARFLDTSRSWFIYPERLCCDSAVFMPVEEDRPEEEVFADQAETIEV